MKRYRIWFAVLGVIAIPAVAAACWPMWGRPAYRPMGYPAPMYAPGPVYVSPPICQPPAPTYVYPPPRIEPIPKIAPPSPAPEMETAIPSPMPPAIVPMRMAENPIRPAGGSDAPPKNVEAPVVEPKPAEASREPDPVYPKVEIPKNLRPDSKAPASGLSKEPDTRAVPKVPAVGAPNDPLVPAIPAAAPPPEALIPPLSVPMLPDANPRDPLPSLTLPPDIPVAPEKKADSTSRSSPLTGGGAADIRVSVFPAWGAEAPAGYCTVGFYNHTTRNLALTIEGRSVQLPAKTYLHAQLGSTFTWSHGNRPSAREAIPDGSGGVDVVFRD